MRRIFTFFREGVGGSLIDLLATRPGHAGAMAATYYGLDGTTSLILFRTLSHELAHAIEAKVQRTKVEGIRLALDSSGFTGETSVDNTTPVTAKSIAVAGVCADAGFTLASLVILRKINPTTAMLWSALDFVSFIAGQDHKVLTEANKHIEMG